MCDFLIITINNSVPSDNIIQHSLHLHITVPIMKSHFSCMKYKKTVKMTILIVCLYYLRVICCTHSLNKMDNGDDYYCCRSSHRSVCNFSMM